MTDNIFRIFNPRASKQDRVEKRRAQLRKAQQTYRDRKGKYARTLEEELGRSRASQAACMRKVESLRGTIQTLLGFLHQLGVDPSEGLDLGHEAITSPLSPPSTVPSPQAYQSQEGLNPRAAACRPQDLHRPGAYGSDRTGCAAPSQIISPFSIAGSHSPWSRDQAPTPGPTPVSRVNSDHSDVRLGDVDPTVLGMEFVLIIEQPCLGHLHGNPDEPDEPGGHALTVSSQVLAMSHETSTGSPGQCESLCQKTPSDMLESLLELSMELCADNEITPTQAWRHIRSQPQFGGLELRALRTLANMLRDSVKCHGFGAVIEQTFFRNLISQVFWHGKPF
ncbi:hypothetical protein CONLIGDRAFT_666449 [Coniochaeta ligniaria NRRL 30616]|uniref:BZIP domain-containing protein n=1 Tax=Coniochaeta ligniaria NRRL 30616 TaxID=1408157 RepID=A0A1J7J0P8_9PEZI|nr:hypothetical protein CONLIGDRAFT_666449 [Coniochaeta ligniaria NRRL 30616]